MSFWNYRSCGQSKGEGAQENGLEKHDEDEKGICGVLDSLEKLLADELIRK